MELISQLRSTHTSLRLLVLSTIEAGDPDRWRVAGASGILDVRTSGGGALAEAMAELASGRTFFPQAPPPRPDYPRTGVLGNLTAREVDVLRQVAAGLDNARIADLLAIGERTVKAHVSSLYRKLGQENRTELALLARRMNLGPESAL
ncbi:MAG: response regulator transcription factor [Myxococcales bacterium]|nr:response regulator transcription factor [Myxococcales bacterium]